MRAVVTGAGGFLGRHLVARLLEAGSTVIATGRDVSRLEALPKSVESHAGDLRDAAWLRGLVERSAPTHVFHLAATIGTEAQSPVRFLEGNGGVTATVLEAVREAAAGALILLASSSAIYGDAGGNAPITEAAPFRPRTAYGASKACQEMLALQYGLGFGMRIVRVRAFNLVGPGLSAALMAGALARQVAEREQGGAPEVLVGDTTARRDFLDVRDAADAYLALAVSGVPSEAYNVCRGHSVSIQECVGLLVRGAVRPLAVRVDPARLRAGDVREQVGDNRKLIAATGWKPSVPLERSLADLLEDCRRQRAT